MKKKICLVLMCILSLLLTVSIVACNKTGSPSNYIVFDGDTIDAQQHIDLNNFQIADFEFEKDGETATVIGWDLGVLLSKVKMKNDKNFLLLTSGDGTIAQIEAELTAKVYLYQSEGKLCIKAPDYPSFLEIKNLQEITVMKQGTSVTGDGLKIVSPTTIANASLETNMTTVVESFGKAKLRLYTTDGVAHGKDTGNLAYKHVLKNSVTLREFENSEQHIAYFEDFDIAKSASELLLKWETGRIKCKVNETTFKTLVGIATGTDKLNFDVYEDMFASLNKKENLMVVLLDGLSWQQVNKYKEYLTLLKSESIDNGRFKKTTTVAATTNIPKSEVALAAILTGKSPFINGVTTNNIKALKVDDIFSVATKLGISTKYIEGTMGMLDTTVPAQTTFPDANGFTDLAVKEATAKAIADGNKFIFAHFHGIDDQNHKTGPISANAQKKLLEVESYVIELVKAFDGKVIIVSDHGQYNYGFDGEIKGNHGDFNSLDMFVPIYTISNGSKWA